MNSNEKIEELKQKIVSTLSPLIDNDYIYIDLPYHANIGDTLIWKGTVDFLKTLPYKCLYNCAFSTYQKPNIGKDVIIMLQGGGNFGDLYRAHPEFRNRIIQDFPDNKIIILPQTIYYKGFKGIQNDLKVMQKHRNLYICARDKYSYNILKRFNFSKNILLLPDMAFCIDSSLLENNKTPDIGKTLVFKRLDKEKSDISDIGGMVGKDCDYSDWPLYEQHDERFEHLKTLIKEQRFAEADEYALSAYLPERVLDGVRFISQYSRIYSNRLHGAILSILLCKEVTIIDNSYGKNAQFYDTWLKDISSIHIHRVRHEFNLKRKIKMIVAWFLTR